MKIGSIVISSGNADELKAWYRDTFAVEEDGDGALEFGPVRVFVFPHSEVGGQAAEPARLMLNLYVDDARGVEKDLKDKGVRFVRPVEEEPFGLLGTIADPDGNYLQLFQPATATAV